MPRIHGGCLEHKRTYTVWQSMHQRCENPKHKYYMYYGAKGITVCERWRDFANFLADMGERPKGKTIDRKKNHLGYFPDNCKWSTVSEQNNNKSNCIFLEHNGETLTLAQWARRIGKVYRVVRSRYIQGYPVELILSPNNLTRSAMRAQKEIRNSSHDK